MIIATDPLPSFEYGVKLLKKHGTLVMVGQPKDGVPFQCVAPPTDLRFFCLVACGADATPMGQVIWTSSSGISGSRAACWRRGTGCRKSSTWSSNTASK